MSVRFTSPDIHLTMITMGAVRCLGHDAILEFVEGKLAAHDENRVHEHVATCADCRQVIAEAARYYLEPGGAAFGMGSSMDAVTARGSRAYRAPSRVHLAQGATVGRYIVVGEKGSGAMGVVYEAFDPQLRRKIALKVLREPYRGDATERQSRLLREAQAMARLIHPNVATVFDAGTFDGQVYVAMELVDGVTLADWLEQAPRSSDAILDVFVAAGRGLAAAHAAGLVHRDFKPHNVLVGKHGVTKVVDFGLASHAIPDDHPQAASHDVVRTHTGMILGTPAYMAPEQFDGLPTNAATDQFAFCVALYEALYGQRPFGGTTIDELAMAVGTGDLRMPPSGIVATQIFHVLARGLQIAAAERFESMEELLAALEEARESAPRARRSTLKLGLAFMAFAGLAAAVIVVALPGPDPTSFTAERPSEPPIAQPETRPLAPPVTVVAIEPPAPVDTPTSTEPAAPTVPAIDAATAKERARTTQAKPRHAVRIEAKKSARAEAPKKPTRKASRVEPMKKAPAPLDAPKTDAAAKNPRVAAPAAPTVDDDALKPFDEGP